MSCATIEPDLVDLARGVAIDADRGAEMNRHLRDCRRCAARLENERAMSAALRRLAQDTETPSPDLRAERALVEAFDAAWAGPRVPVRSRPSRTMTAAALVTLAATLVWTIANRPAHVPTPAAGTLPAAAVGVETLAPHVPPAPVVVGTDARVRPGRRTGDGRPPGAAAAMPGRPRPQRHGRVTALRAEREFVTWPGAADLPTFESGHLMRMDLPASIVRSLGLVPLASRAGVVHADLLVGQDGFPRAVRLVP